MSYMTEDDLTFSGGVVTMPTTPASIVSPRGLRWPRIDYAHPWNYVPPGHTRSPRGYRRSMNTRGWVPTPGIGATEVLYGPELPADWVSPYSTGEGTSPAPVPVGAPLPKTPSATSVFLTDLTKIIGAIVPAGATAYSQYQAQKAATKAAKATPAGMPVAAPQQGYQPAPAGGDNTLALVGLGIAGALALVYFMK